MKGMYELWGEGSSYEELEESIKNCPDDLKLPYLSSDTTFKITVDSFGKIMSFQDQNDRIRQLSYIPFKVPFLSVQIICFVVCCGLTFSILVVLLIWLFCLAILCEV